MLYLTHDTEQAVKEGKAQYQIEEYITNKISKSEILQIREGVTNLSVDAKVTMQMLTDLDEKSYKLGYDGGDWQNFYDELPFVVRASAKKKIIEESYERGKRHRNRDKKIECENRIKEFGKQFPNCIEDGKIKSDCFHEYFDWERGLENGKTQNIG